MKKIINLILILILIFSSYKIVSKISEYKKADNIYNELQSEKDSLSSSNNIIDLTHINEDYIGWIEIPNTNINYPVLQSEDNNYYLKRDIYKNYLASGSIFLDYRNNDFSDENTVIYGHYMRNNTMFGQLKKFKEEKFFNKNKITKKGQI